MHSPFKAIPNTSILFGGHTDFIHLYSLVRNLKIDLFIESPLAKNAILPGIFGFFESKTFTSIWDLVNCFH